MQNIHDDNLRVNKELRKTIRCLVHPQAKDSYDEDTEDKVIDKSNSLRNLHFSNRNFGFKRNQQYF